MALCLLHGIGKKCPERISSHLSTNITPVQDKRGRHTNRPNVIPEDLKRQVHEHIRSFPKQVLFVERFKYLNHV